MLNCSFYKNSLLVFGIIVLSFSCTNKKKFIYFQGSSPGSQANQSYSPILKPDDLLSITVMGLEESAVKPFNLPLTISQNIGGYTQGAPTQPGYLIDVDGNIDFPVIGKIKIGGLSRQAAIELLKEQLKPYLQNPTIIMRIINYKVTVLGEVKNPGTFTIPNERISILEAIGIAGDLLITGKRKNIIVIREENGKRMETRIDLTNKDVFNSPVFYLQQNDVVYVEPNRTKINSSAVNTANVSLVVSVISLFVTMVVLFRQ
jgi:polysaccharide export outer membrane protein